jgi:hypothetical protein
MKIVFLEAMYTSIASSIILLSLTPLQKLTMYDDLVMYLTYFGLSLPFILPQYRNIYRY